MDKLSLSIRKRLMEDLTSPPIVHDTLNPKLFNDAGQLLPEVKSKMIEIIRAFLDYIQIDTGIYDIRLVGSNAAYNYRDDSDIDLHIIIDLSTVSNPESIARMYLDSAKKNFNDKYDIKIKGSEVEVYVEDINSTSISNGVYSILQDKWIKYPQEVKPISPEVLSQVEDRKAQIVSQASKATTIDDLSNIIDSIYLMRKDSLATTGEYGIDNLVFKELRNDGFLYTLKDKLDDLMSKELSLESKKVEV